MVLLCGVIFAPAQITITPPDGGTNGGGGLINTNAVLDPTNAVLKNIITTLALTNFGRVIFVATNGNPASQGGMTPIDTVSNAVRVAKLTGIDTIIVLPGDHYYRAPTNTVQDSAIRISDYPGRLHIMGLGWNSRLWSDREGTCFMISNTGPVTIENLNITGFRKTDVANVFGPGPGNGIAIDTKVGNVRILNVRLSDFQRFGAGSFAFNSTPFTNDVIFSGCVASNCGSFFPTFLTGINDGAGFVMGPNYTLDNCLIQNCTKGIEIYGNDVGTTNRPNAHVRVLNTRFRNILGEHVFNGGYSNNMDVIFRNCSFIDDPGYVRYDGSNYITGGAPVMFMLGLMQNVRFEDNYVQPHYAVGLSIVGNAQDLRGARVTRNKFFGMHNPIQAGDATGGTANGIRDLIIEQNDFYDFGGRAIQLIGVRDSLIKNNRFFNGSTNGTLANIYIAGTAPNAHSSNILVEANQHFDFNTVPGNSYCLEIAAGSQAIKAVNNDWNSFATGAFLDAGTNTLIIGRNQTGIGIGTNQPTQRLEVNGNIRTKGTNYVGKIHLTDGSIPTNSLLWINNGTNIAGLPFGYGLAISNGFLISTNVGGTNIVGGGSSPATNVFQYGNFGFLATTNASQVQTHPNNTSWLILSNYNYFIGSNFTGVPVSGMITNRMPSGFVDVDAVVQVDFLDPGTFIEIGIMTNGIMTQLRVRYRVHSPSLDDVPISLHGVLFLPTNVWVGIAVQASAAATEWIPAMYYLAVRSFDSRIDLLSSGGGSSTLAGDVFANSITVTNGIYQAVTNLGNAAVVTMVWDGPNTIRWGPTNNGVLTGGGTSPTGGGPARHWTLEVYPGGYTNLIFPGAFKWIDGGPFYDPSRTNIFDLKFTGSNFVAFTVPNGTLSAASANVSGHWIAPPAGIIGGSVNSQFRSNLTADALFIVSNLVNESELEIIANGAQGTISNANSIMWMEGAQPFISTNGRTLLRFWATAGVTNGMVLSGQIEELTEGNSISLVKDLPNHRITIHYTGSGGGGVANSFNSDQFDVIDGAVTFKQMAKTTNAISYGGQTIADDPETGEPGNLAASYISAVRYVDIGVTNLGNGNVVTMIWNGPSLIRWWPTNNGALTGGGLAPQSGDSARLWRFIIWGGATNITWPGAFQWIDGGPYYRVGSTNVYEVQFTTTNYLARRISPGNEDYYEQGTNVVFYTNPVTKRLVINASAAGGGSGGGGSFPKLIEHFVGGNSVSNIGNLGWQYSTTGTAPTQTGATGEPGSVQLTTSAALSNWCNIYLGTSSQFGVQTNYAWTNRFQVSVPGATYFSNMTFRAGFTDSVNAFTNPAAGIFLTFTNGPGGVGSAGNWFGVVTVAPGVETIVNTGISSGSVQTFTNEIRSTGNGLITFAINGVATTAVAGGPGTVLRPFFSLTTTETAAKFMNVLYWDFNWTRTYYTEGVGGSGGSTDGLQWGSQILTNLSGITSTNQIVFTNQLTQVASNAVVVTNGYGIAVTPSGSAGQQTFTVGASIGAPLALLQRGTNLWADGGVGRYWRQDLFAGVGNLTNIMFTNMAIGDQITVELWATNGVTAQAPQFSASDFGGTIPRFTTNVLLTLIAKRTGTAETNVTLTGGDYKQVYGSGITAITNDSLREVSISAAGGGGGGYRYVISDEFIGGTGTSGSIGTHGWQFAGTTPTIGATLGRPGLEVLNTTTTFTNFNSFFLGPSTVIGNLTNIPWTNQVIIGISGATSLTNSTFRDGWGDAVSGPNPPGSGIYFSVTNTATTGNWFGILNNAGTETIVNLGVTASTSYVTNEVRHSGNGLIRFAINGTESAAQTGCPNVSMRPFFCVVKNEATIDTAGTKILNIDYWDFCPAINRR